MAELASDVRRGHWEVLILAGSGALRAFACGICATIAMQGCRRVISLQVIGRRRLCEAGTPGSMGAKDGQDEEASRKDHRWSWKDHR